MTCIVKGFPSSISALQFEYVSLGHVVKTPFYSDCTPGLYHTWLYLITSGAILSTSLDDYTFALLMRASSNSRKLGGHGRIAI